MTVHELLKILAGMPGDLDVMITTGREIYPVGFTAVSETSETGEVFLLSTEEAF